MSDLTDRRIVVTGGSGALGKAAVERLLEAGATCHVPVYAPTELDRFPFRSHHRVEVRAGLDFTVEDTVRRYYEELPSLWASIHVAGGFAMGPIVDTSLNEFLEMMNTNAVTCFLSCREAVRAIRRSGAGEGRIVNVAARPVLVPTAGMSAYVASKAVVASLTQSLAEELAEERIWVNAIAPSVLDTPANREAMPEADFGSWPKLEEVAETLCHLVSPANRTVRGAILPVYGRA
ncbi:MAG: SDR family NAD(P)-dependent oxidoreductase [Sandaracinaceae bacterium]